MANDLLDDLLENASEEETKIAEVVSEEDKKLKPLLNEINSIEDNSIQQFVRSILLKATNFWEIPSSSSLDRPPDELSVGGNVLHTGRVARIVRLMAEAELRERYDIDVLIAAALIHDVTKGVEWLDVISLDPMHPYTLDAYVKNAIDTDGEKMDELGKSSTLYLEDMTIAHILRIARCHLGFESPIPETYPISTPDWILHWANLLASQLHVIIDGDEIELKRWMTVESEVPKEAVSN